MARSVIKGHGQILFLPHVLGVEVHFHLKGFGPNETHAIHIHEFQSPTLDCAEMGGHFNPTNMPHGSHIYDSPQSHHAGDLINNFTTDKKGNFEYVYIDPAISVDVRSKKCIIGRSLVIHGFPDDLGKKGRWINGNLLPYRNMNDSQLIDICKDLQYKNLRTREQRISKLEEESLKTGNAGKRIACGNIEKYKF